MAKFSEVFSTTLKVVGALAIISVVLGIGYAIISGLGNAGGSSSTTTA